MKHLLFSIILLCSAAGLQAQTEAYADASPLPKSGGTEATAAAAKKQNITMKDVIYVTPANQWSLIDMKVAGDIAYFKNIDGLSSLKVFVTNSDGVSMMEARINAKANGINFKRLKKGLYFLTLVNETTDERKAFTLNRE